MSPIGVGNVDAFVYSSISLVSSPSKGGFPDLSTLSSYSNNYFFSGGKLRGKRIPSSLCFVFSACYVPIHLFFLINYQVLRA